MPDEDRLAWYILSAAVPFYENLAGVESKVADWSKADKTGFCFGNEEVLAFIGRTHQRRTG